MKVCQLCLRFCMGIAVLSLPLHGISQAMLPARSEPVRQAHAETALVSGLPDAPLPQGGLPTPVTAPEEGVASSGRLEATKQDDAGLEEAGQDASKPSAGSSQAQTSQDQQNLADEQLRKQKQQRTLGLVPAFNISYVYNPVPLTAKQKFALAFRSEIDPAAFGVSMFVAGIEQAEGAHRGYGGGWGGYAKRFGQSYTDSFDGQMLGNALLPSLLHQDPRYFRLGRGPAKRRILYALGTNVIAHHDGTGRWEPNYSNVLGNFAAGGISNLYLPKEDRGFSSTVTGALVVIAEGGAGSLFQEFWPDIARRYLHKDPTRGQDAINAKLPDPTGGHHLFYNPPKHPKGEDKAPKPAPNGDQQNH
jgi:hypothetical protein